MRNVCKYMLGILGGILFCKTTVFAAEIIPTNVISCEVSLSNLI